MFTKAIKSKMTYPMALLVFISVLTKAEYSPAVGQFYPNAVYWGDTHVHTNMSVDANGLGNRNLTPNDAYRFAKGEAVIAHNGQPAQLSRPLDFLVVADHAVNMGVMPKLALADVDLLKTKLGERWYKGLMDSPRDTGLALNEPTGQLLNDAWRSVTAGAGNLFSRSWYFKEDDRDKAEVFLDEALQQSVWADVANNADRHNVPGQFTTFIGYEWTAQALYQPQSAIHRVVLFKDDASKVTQVRPFSYFDSDSPEDLWAYFDLYEKNTDGQILAIPHNSNLSNGIMFALKDAKGQKMNQDYAQDYAARRSRWEPLVEVTQIKGDSETHPILSPNDEFVTNYETWNNWNGWAMEGVSTEGWEERKRHSYARSALGLGLQAHSRLGINPFKFGMIGSTDSHTSLATADENNFWGKLSYYEPSKHRAASRSLNDNPKSQGRWEYAASGYAAIWARGNTRESLFAAMKRKEVYATTGPRITVRFFGGWEYETNDAQRPDLARIGYSKGVPMGGDLSNAPQGQAPIFLIRAVKDPDGANLDRVQVIKGWNDENSELHEKIYNVALSDGRKVNKGNKSPPVGNTVNVTDASYTNTIGDPELAVVWQDPDFNENELAFYYLRVLEIPTPRWTAYDAKFFGLKSIPEEVPMVTQERAYTSPIWYSPPAKAGGE